MKHEYLSKRLQERVTASLSNLKVIHILRITREKVKKKIATFQRCYSHHELPIHRCSFFSSEVPLIFCVSVFFLFFSVIGKSRRPEILYEMIIHVSTQINIIPPTVREL